MLFSLISKHVAATGSPRGKWVLENWPQMLPKFVKVYPSDLRALALKAAAEAPKPINATEQGASLHA